MSNVTAQFEATRRYVLDTIDRQMQSRAVRGSNQLRTAALLVLRGQRSGRRYKVPGTYARNAPRGDNETRETYEYRKNKGGRYYAASAPGEPPAVRTGLFRLSWEPHAYLEGNLYRSTIENRTRTENGKYLLGELLEDGTRKMAPRPHHERIQKKALPKILSIYREPYF